MELNFNIFISHDSNDETVAVALKNFLENIFLNASVYVSGRDLQGGQTWIENIKMSLKNSQVIVSLISTESLNNNWIYFETGAGFIEDKSIPLISDGLIFKDLYPPLSLLQARTLTILGVESLVSDIAKIVRLRTPKILNGIDELIKESDSFFNLRKNEKAASAKSKSVVKVVRTVSKSIPDPDLLEKHRVIEERAKKLTILKINTFRDKFDLPTDKEIQEMHLGTLQDLSNAFNIEYPSRAYAKIFMTKFKIPEENAQKWVKLNIEKQLEDANIALDKYEKTI